MISFGIGVVRLGRLPDWSQSAALFAEWRRRVQARHELDRLSDRDLADMRLTRLDALDEMQKPFGKRSCDPRMRESRSERVRI
jgi:uncharacterized protein YjiS (DUF1127 family)